MGRRGGGLGEQEYHTQLIFPHEWDTHGQTLPRHGHGTHGNPTPQIPFFCHALMEKRTGLSPGGRFPPSFINQVIIITGLNKEYDCMFSP